MKGGHSKAGSSGGAFIYFSAMIGVYKLEKASVVPRGRALVGLTFEMIFGPS